MKLAVIGSRSFASYPLLRRVIFAHFYENSTLPRFTAIVSGACPTGADAMAAQFYRDEMLEEHGVELIEFPADWDKHGKGAGFMRNEDIVKTADVVLAFHDGQSRGTQNSLDIARRLRKTTLIIYFTPTQS